MGMPKKFEKPIYNEFNEEDHMPTYKEKLHEFLFKDRNLSNISIYPGSKIHEYTQEEIYEEIYKALTGPAGTLDILDSNLKKKHIDEFLKESEEKKSTEVKKRKLKNAYQEITLEGAKIFNSRSSARRWLKGLDAVQNSKEAHKYILDLGINGKWNCYIDSFMYSPGVYIDFSRV